MEVRVLPAHVQSRLRSGVAITSVAQCVEELVLNSLDAGAMCIAVRVDLTTFTIQVVDNGSGISREDLKLIGDRYSTSKCHNLKDLDSLEYFGFRGEALTSLRDVTTALEIHSRYRQSSMTYCKLFKHGKPVAVAESKYPRPCPGTTITVHDLFYNLPVRQQNIFPALELERTRYRMEGISLINPSISFSLRNNATGHILLQTQKSNSILTAFMYLFGGNLSKHLKPVAIDRKPFHIEGYIGKDGYNKKLLQFVYVNNRLVLKTQIHKIVNKTMTNCINFRRKTWKDIKSSTKSTPPRCMEKHPMFVINIKCPLNIYDITFDPKKTLVEFKDWETLTSAVETMVTDFLKAENLWYGTETGLPNHYSNPTEPLKSSNEHGDIQKKTESKQELQVSNEPEISTLNTSNSLFSKTVFRKRLRNPNKRTPGPSVFKVSTPVQIIDKNNKTSIKISKSSDRQKAVEEFAQKLSIDLNPESCDFESEDELPIKEQNKKTGQNEAIRSWSQTTSVDIFQEETSKDNFPEETSSPYTFQKETSSQNAFLEEASSRDTYLDETSSEEAVQEEISSRDTFFEETSSGEALQEETSSRDTYLESTSSRDIVLEETSSGDIVLEETSYGEAYPEECSSRESFLEEASSSDAYLEEASSQDAYLEETSSRDAYLEKASSRDAYLKEASSRDAYLEETSSPEYVQEDTSSRIEESPFQYTSQEDPLPLNKIKETNLLPPPKFLHDPHPEFITLSSDDGFISTIETLRPKKRVQKKNEKNLTAAQKISLRLKERSEISFQDKETASKTSKILEKFRKRSRRKVAEAVTSVISSNSNNSTGAVELSKAKAYTSNLPEVIASSNTNNNNRNTESISDIKDQLLDKKRTNIVRVDAPIQNLPTKFMTSESFVMTPRTALAEVLPLLRQAKRQKENIQNHEKCSSILRNPESRNGSSHINKASVVDAFLDETFKRPHPIDHSRRYHTSKFSPYGRSCTGQGPSKHLQKSPPKRMEGVDNTDEHTEKFIGSSQGFTLKVHPSSTHGAIDLFRTVNPSTDPIPESQGFSVNDSSSQVSCSFTRYDKNQSKTDHTFPSSLPLECSKQDGMTLPSSIENTTSAHSEIPINQNLTDSQINTSTQMDTNQSLHSGHLPLSEGPVVTSSPIHQAMEEILNSCEYDTVKGFQQNISGALTQVNDSEMCVDSITQGSETSKSSDVQSVNDGENEMDSSFQCGQKHCSWKNAKPFTDSYSITDLLSDSSQTALENSVTCDSHLSSSDKQFENKSQESDMTGVKDQSESGSLQKYRKGEEINGTKEVLETDRGNVQDIWIEMTDKNSGKSIHVNKLTGNTVYEKEWLILKQKFEKPGFESSDSILYNMKTSSNITNLCNNDTNKLYGMLLNHLDTDQEEQNIKWRNKDEAEIDSQTGDSVIDEMFNQWKNPVHHKSNQCGINTEVNHSSRSAVTSYQSLNKITFTKDMLSCMKVLGQVDSKFIACLISSTAQLQNKVMVPDLLVMLDQHAAHERVRLEQYISELFEEGEEESDKVKESEITPPLSLTLRQEDIRVMISFKQEFFRIGIRFSCVEDNRNEIKLNSIPACIVEREANELKRGKNSIATQFVEELITEHVEYLKNTSGSRRRLPLALQRILATKACRGAIKFNDNLSQAQCKELITALSTCDLPFQCAHGRPSVIPLFKLDTKLYQHTQVKAKPRLDKLMKGKPQH